MVNCVLENKSNDVFLTSKAVSIKGGKGVLVKNVKNFLIGSVALSAAALSMFATPQIAFG